jgi:hypothetical protein
MGAVGSGKSTLANEYVNCYSESGIVIAFADVLKQIAKDEGGWNGIKDEAGRAFIQDFSEEYKRMHGDDIFTRIAFERALSHKGDVVILEDTRFSIEISRALSLRKLGVPLTLFLIHNEAAEHRWASAYAKFISGDESCKWSGHRSELEWRAFRSIWTNQLVYKNEYDDAAPVYDAHGYRDFITEAFNNPSYKYAY